MQRSLTHTHTHTPHTYLDRLLPRSVITRVLNERQSNPVLSEVECLTTYYVPIKRVLVLLMVRSSHQWRNIRRYRPTCNYRDVRLKTLKSFHVNVEMKNVKTFRNWLTFQ